MKRLISLLSLSAVALAGLVFTPVLSAQENNNNNDDAPKASDKFWVCIFGCPKTAVTTIKVQAITSVNKHTYNVGNQLVKEVTIDTTGNNSIRIYCTNTNSQQKQYKDRLSNTRKLIERKTGTNSELPTKSFPEGTYSHNVEYQVEKPETLDKIYDSVIKAISTNKGTTLRV